MKEIQLTTGQTVIISDEDFERVSQHNWYPAGKGYAQTSIGGKCIYLHRFIMNARPDQEVDHANGIKSDYQRENLRICTHSQNCANRSPQSNCKLGVKGVSWHRGKYRAVIRINRKNIDLGRSKSLREAAEMYNRGAIKYFGEFAYQNDLEAIHA